MRYFLNRWLLLVILTLTGLAQAQQPTPASGDEMTVLQMPSGDINTLLDYYEKLSGKILIRDANITPVPNLRIVAPGSIPKSQAIRLIESVLLLNGYALIPAGDNSVKVVNATGGKNPRSEGIAVYANLADLPEGEEVATYYMQLRYLSAQEALPIFQAQVPNHPYGVFVPVNNAQAVVITENASVIRQLAKLQELVDVPPAKVISQFVSLQRADAERVADIINKLIESRKNSAQANGTAPAANAPAPAPGEAAASISLNERTLVAGTVQLIADARTNRILVVTRPINFDYIKDLIEQFDQAATLSAPLERPLKYVMAADVLPVLQTLLAEDKDADASGNPSQANRPSTNSPQRSQSNSNNNSGNNGGGSGVSTDRTLEENQDTAPEAVMVGKTRLVADKQANSIIVIGPPESVNKVSAILDRLDKKPMQVYLSTVIGQMTYTDNSELAIDLLQKYGTSGSFGAATSSLNRSDTATGTVNPVSLTNAGAFTNLATGLTIYGTIGSALDYYVKALQSTKKFKLISRPVIFTANNKGAVISSGQKIAVPESTLTSLDNGTVNSGSVAANINYTDVDLKLEVVPLINSEREVTLRIKQTNDTVVGSQTISGNSVPTIGTQFVDTTITVQNKATVVLGGLISEDNTNTVTGIPFLKDIPVLGYLFKGTVKSKDRTELIIMIQPTVVGTDEELAAASQEEVNRNKIGPVSKAFSDDRPISLEKNKVLEPKTPEAKESDAVPTPTPPAGETTTPVNDASPP